MTTQVVRQSRHWATQRDKLTDISAARIQKTRIVLRAEFSSATANRYLCVCASAVLNLAVAHGMIKHVPKIQLVTLREHDPA